MINPNQIDELAIIMLISLKDKKSNKIYYKKNHLFTYNDRSIMDLYNKNIKKKILPIKYEKKNFFLYHKNKFACYYHRFKFFLYN